MSTVVLDKVTKVYPGGYLAVDRLSLSADEGELLVLLGPSGCGKSTLLRMIAGLEEITSGDLWLDGELANHLAPRDRDVAMVFQNGALYPHRTVRGNLAFPLEIAKADPATSRNAWWSSPKALHIDEMLDRRPGTLSGGQRQRVAMGRAIVRQPSLFLMDEPLSNLDAGMRTELRMEISALVRSLGVTTIYVTHDQVEALSLADRIAILNRGVLQDMGTPAQVYNDPATAFVAAFLNSQQLNLLAATVRTPQNQYVLLDFGPHRLTMPWNDPRAYAVSQHVGGQILVGIRPDALVPVPPTRRAGPVLRRPGAHARVPRPRVARLPRRRGCRPCPCPSRPTRARTPTAATARARGRRRCCAGCSWAAGGARAAAGQPPPARTAGPT